jgi:Cu-processing system permease protein
MSAVPTVPGPISAGRTIVGYAMAEGLRRKVFAVVVGLTVGFLVLYALGAFFAFRDVNDSAIAGSGQGLVDQRALTGGTIFGLGMFAVLFLGAVLAVFLTNGVVRGDAEAGLLQPLVVRPLGRGTMLVARYLGAVSVTTGYVLVIYAVALLVTKATGDWTPASIVLPGLALALAVAIVAAISLLLSVLLSATAQGIAVFMIFGAGLVGGLLGQIGDALDSSTLSNISKVLSTALPFEALYQAGLHLITSDETGFTKAVIQLGPFGGAQAAGSWLAFFSLAYAAAVIAVSVWAFGRRDL